MERDKPFSILHSLVYLGLSAGLMVLSYLVLRMSIPVSLVFSVSPLIILAGIKLAMNPLLAFLLLFTVNYFIMGITRYVPGLMGGVVIDALVLLVFLCIIITSLSRKRDWEILKNGLTVVTLIWLVFCLLNVLNPESPAAAWVIGIRRTAVYFFAIPALTFLLLSRYRDVKKILIIWSVFVVLAMIKAFIQKIIGFDNAELRWLYVEGKAATHIIYSGIRYFSFFTDAANFGCGMAFSMVFFSIVAFFSKNSFLRYYFLFVATLAGIGVLISGTRAAIAIPFASYTLFALLSRKIKILISFSAVLLAAFVFLSFTNYGQGNTYVRRMRTIFHSEKDASFNLRLENQKKMRAFMADKYFGVGIGTAKAQEYSTAEISKIPTDSWLVMVWVETGIIGLIIYLASIGYILGKGVYLVMFKVKDPELRAVEGAFISAIFGIFVASYANEVIAQFPNGPIIYMSMAFVFMAKHYDQQLSEKTKANLSADGSNA